MTVTAATTFLALAASGEVNAEELGEKLQSSTASSAEKTSFIIEYLLSQRSVIMDGLKTLLFALVVYLVGRRVMRWCLKLTARWMEKREVDLGVRDFVMSFARVGYHLLLIFAVAGILGVGATVVAVVGSAGLAIGLALQGSLANLAGGVLILALKPFKVGDTIQAEGAEGVVESIDIFYTRVVTSDNRVVVIPNGTITNANITNNTSLARRLLVIDFRIPYGTDVERVRGLLLEMMGGEPLLLQEEPMRVAVASLTPVKLKMQAKAWVETEKYWDARYQVAERIKVILEEQGIDLS